MKNPLYILTASPEQTSKFKDFFSPGENSVINLLEHPSNLRYGGWDLKTYDNARIIKGEYLEIRAGENKNINLYEDGALIVSALANEKYLSHASKEFELSPRLNPVALIEFTYNFVSFYEKLLSHLTGEPEDILFTIRFKDFFQEKGKIYLSPYGVDSLTWMFGSEKRESPENDMVREINIKTENIIGNPGIVTYKIIEKIYLWFGFTVDKIPYTSEINSVKYIDPEKIIGKKSPV